MATPRVAQFGYLLIEVLPDLDQGRSDFRMSFDYFRALSQSHAKYLDKGQYRNAVASGGLAHQKLSGALIRRHPTLPRYGTDLYPTLVSDFEAKQFVIKITMKQR